MSLHHYGTQEVNRGAVQPGMLVNHKEAKQAYDIGFLDEKKVTP